ncbi:hypothetical protein [Thermoflexus sp.]|uniref:hypothetical protein n=1 Tax=Thermoflexus sp. TaxID=1969742 RepID=UPI002ADDEC68|nr:hypothetical protein [Thermoflexus sp.]
MTWELYRWAWRLESPLHIGAPPAGALNRTRLYVPARTLWGALTAEIARRHSAGFPEYQAVGAQLQREARLSYLFPAELVGGRWRAWLPRYAEGEGLVWQREEDSCSLEDRAFRARLLFSRPGTAIAPESDTAEEGTLREFDLLNPYWKDDNQALRPVAMVGYFFCRDERIIRLVEEVQELFVGGDTRYGLGRLRRVAWDPASAFFNGDPVDLRGDSPETRTSRALAHVEAAGSPEMRGALECIGGWDIAAGLISPTLAWAPGSVTTAPQSFRIQEDGRWRSG